MNLSNCRRVALPVQNIPALLLRVPVELDVGVDRAGVAEQLEPDQVGVAVAVAVRLAEVESVLVGVVAQPRGAGFVDVDVKTCSARLALTARARNP